MKDQLKKYVDTHREQFETVKAGHSELDDMWEKIAANLDQAEHTAVKAVPLSGGGPAPSHNSGMRMFWRVAAAVILLLGAALLWFRLQSPDPLSAQNAYPELMEAEQYYAPIINEKMKVIQARRAEIGEGVFNDLAAIDKALSELREDLKEDVSNATVIDAMIQNYRIKLQILEEISQQIKESNEPDKNGVPEI